MQWSIAKMTPDYQMEILYIAIVIQTRPQMDGWMSPVFVAGTPCYYYKCILQWNSISFPFDYFFSPNTPIYPFNCVFAHELDWQICVHYTHHHKY